MKLDKKSVEMLSSLPDGALWQMVSVIASTAGIRMPSSPPDEKSMSGLRGALSELSENDISRATELFEKYKEGRSK